MIKPYFIFYFINNNLREYINILLAKCFSVTCFLVQPMELSK
jgi:hypothetical protein